MGDLGDCPVRLTPSWWHTEATQDTNARCHHHCKFCCFFCSLDDGKDAGRALEIITTETKHRGELGVCSQPLHTNRAWLHDWAKHYLGIGAEAIIMHVPRVRHPLPISGHAAQPVSRQPQGHLHSGCSCMDCSHMECIEARLIPDSLPSCRGPTLMSSLAIGGRRG